MQLRCTAQLAPLRLGVRRFLAVILACTSATNSVGTAHHFGFAGVVVPFGRRAREA